MTWSSLLRIWRSAGPGASLLDVTRTRTILSSVLLAAALLGGCVDDNPGFYIRSNVTPDSQCAWSGSSSEAGQGILDIGYGYAHYGIYPVYNSQLRSRLSNNPPRIDTNGIQIQSANIRLTDAAGTLLPIPQPAYSVTASGFVPTSVDNTPGEGIGFIDAIPVLAANDIRNLNLVAPPDMTTSPITPGTTLDIVVHITVMGRTVGGEDVQAAEWTWPVTICDQCRACFGEPPDVACHPGQDNEGWFDSCPAES